MKCKPCILIFFLISTLNAFLQAPDYSKIKITSFVKCAPVEDQQYSSTCWSFASASFIESEIYRKQGVFYDLSEMYFSRYSYINKISAYLKADGNIYFTPGGQFHDVLEVIKTRGAVPEQSYNGDPFSTHYYNYSMLDTLVWQYTRSLLQLHRKKPTAHDWKVYNNLFDTYMGKVASNFKYNGKTYSPKSFVSNALELNPDDYIEITSYTHRPFYESFILEDKFNWMKKEYYNVPLEDFVEITNNAIQTGYSVCWDGDVTEPTFDEVQWSAYLAEDVKADQATRQQMYVDTTSKIDHLMHVVGFGKDDKNNTWYYIKNSWGKYGPNFGYFCMSLNYFKLKTIAIIVHKDAIPLSIKTKMKL